MTMPEFPNPNDAGVTIDTDAAFGTCDSPDCETSSHANLVEGGLIKATVCLDCLDALEQPAFEHVQTVDIPDATLDVCPPVGEWGEKAHAPDPTMVEPSPCAICDDEMYHVQLSESCPCCGHGACFVDADGEKRGGTYVEDPGATPYNLACGDSNVSDAAHMICGWCYNELVRGPPEELTVAGETYAWWREGTVVYDLGALDSSYAEFHWNGPCGAMYAYLNGEIKLDELADRLDADPDDPSKPARSGGSP